MWIFDIPSQLLPFVIIICIFDTSNDGNNTGNIVDRSYSFPVALDVKYIVLIIIVIVTS